MAKRRNLLQSINNFPPEEPCDIELVTLYISANIQTKANIQNVLKHEEHNNKQIEIKNRKKREKKSKIKTKKKKRVGGESVEHKE